MSLVDITLEQIRKSIEKFVPVKEIRYIASKRIAFVDFKNPHDCSVLVARCQDGEVSIAGTNNKLTASFSAGLTLHDTQLRVQLEMKQKAEEVLMLCPGLVLSGQYYTDNEKLWLFDPSNLYWFHTERKQYFGMTEDKELVPVDAEGKVMDGERYPLPGLVCLASRVDESQAQKIKSMSLTHHVVLDEPSQLPEPIIRIGQGIVCTLCQRKFSSLEALRKHENLSQLHRSNLNRNK